MSSGDLCMNQKLFCDASQEIALFMYNVGITEKPELSFFENDNGIFEKLFFEHATEENIMVLKSISEDVYLRVLGMHAFGAGVYTAAKERDLGRGVSEFTKEEVDGIFAEFDTADAYELALMKLGFPIDSGNRQMLDRVIVIGMKEAKLISGDEITEPQNTRAFMKVLYNAGISLYKLRKKG